MQMDHNDHYTVHDLLELKKNKMLAANPEYQRGEVWDTPRRKRLIDSILRGYPIPLIYLHHIKREVAGMQREDLEIIDGQQRITALHEFREGAFKLFDPVKDEKEARFPTFLKSMPCPWAGHAFDSLPADLKSAFLNTKLAVVKIRTTNSNEARDLFIRLQAGLPLNAQEKRDAWPGNFTEFILKLGGKTGVAKYSGHDFFRRVMGAKSGGKRGEVRQLCAQMTMLFFAKRQSGGERLTDINAKAIDDFYYQNLDFDAAAPNAVRFTNILDKLTMLLGDGKRRPLKGHEVFHVVLLMDSLIDDYTKSWEDRLAGAFDRFMARLAEGKKTRWEAVPDEFWIRYGALTRTNSDREQTIRLRHEFFVEKMFELMAPLQLKDPQRLFGTVEREILYYRDKKACAVCDGSVVWSEAEAHHVDEHTKGGKTVLENAVLVHAACHPNGTSAVQVLAAKLRARRNNPKGQHYPATGTLSPKEAQKRIMDKVWEIVESEDRPEPGTGR
jgi:hypothetical protein